MPSKRWPEIELEINYIEYSIDKTIRQSMDFIL